MFNFKANKNWYVFSTVRATDILFKKTFSFKKLSFPKPPTKDFSPTFIAPKFYLVILISFIKGHKLSCLYSS